MTISANSKENYQVEISAKAHNLILDEALDFGGEDAGPTPSEMLLASLAGCKIITAQKYARRKEWSLDDVKVRISKERIYGEDCDDCATEGKEKVDIFNVKIEFIGDLSTEQKLRLHEITGRCPIHKTLTTETKIRSVLVGRRSGNS